MIRFLRSLYLRRRLQQHQAWLGASAVIGEGFCSASYVGELNLLNFRVNNLTGDRERIRIGRCCNIAATLLLDSKGSVVIGDYVYFNADGFLRIAHGLRIGSHCLFGPQVVIWDTDSHPLSRQERHAQAERIPTDRISPYEAKGGPIEIGNDVWVCMGALLLGGIKIGDGAIVAARAVVTKDVPPMTMVGGCPARVIGQVPE